MSEESVKVAVRVRPFNKRERARNATCIVEMKGQSTYLTDPEEPNEEPRSFTFDHSYWSHDGSVEGADGYYGPDSKHPNGKKFADQKTVYKDLGVGVMTNAWEGYNSTLFAYGQTGSGKSWSVVGYGVNKGIVPQFCAEIFAAIDEKKKGGEATQYEVQFSMLEIYNEIVRDLLNPDGGRKKGLRVRQHPKKGFYAEKLTETPVDNYKEIESKMEEGTLNRTVASTKMNATSSRAHTIVGIYFTQKFKNAAGEETEKKSIVNLVDLAGSERAENTGATGDRLKEGAAINQSLSSLGNCIAALADRAQGKRVKVPFRDSVLTKLLKNALGGNSKTVMIAAISPADINYDETLSTLRYADRAKQIKTKVTVNEDPTEKLIRELQEENERLKKMMAEGKVDMPLDEDDDEEGMSKEELEALKKEIADDYKAELVENEREMEEMKKSFEDKLKAAREQGGGTNFNEKAEKMKKTLHLSNLNMDPQLSGKVVHFIEGNSVKIGRKDCDITLYGPSINPEHAIVKQEGSKVYLEEADDARVIINGEEVTEKVELHHNDRIMFGTTQLFLLVNPKERDGSKGKYETFTYEMAMEEMANCSGFDMKTENKSPEDLILQDGLADILPAIEEANSISAELDKKKKFETTIVTAEARGEMKGRTQVYIRVLDLETDHEWFWPKDKFLDRKAVMQEMYEDYSDGDDWKLPKEKDPFEIDPDVDEHIGSVKVWLKSMAYKIECKDNLEITDFRGVQEGKLEVEIVPCSKKGKEYTLEDDEFVDSPQDLIDKDLHFVVKINSAKGLNSMFSDVYAKYKVYNDEEFTETKAIKDSADPVWNHKKQFSFTPCTKEFVKFLEEGAVMIQIWAKQKPPKEKKSVNTKDAMKKMSRKKGQMSAANNNMKLVDPLKVQYAMELQVMKKRQELLEMRMKYFKKMLETAKELRVPRVSTKIIKDLVDSHTEDQAEKCVKLVRKEPNEDEIEKDDDGKTASKTCVLL